MVKGGQKAKGKQRYTRSIFDRMFDTTDESSDDKCLGGSSGADHPPLENEFNEDESSDVLGISGSPGPRPTITPAAASAGDEQQRGFSPCLLYTSPSPRDGLLSRMPSSA